MYKSGRISTLIQYVIKLGSKNMKHAFKVKILTAMLLLSIGLAAADENDTDQDWLSPNDDWSGIGFAHTYNWYPTHAYNWYPTYTRHWNPIHTSVWSYNSYDPWWRTNVYHSYPTSTYYYYTYPSWYSTRTYYHYSGGFLMGGGVYLS